MEEQQYSMLDTYQECNVIYKMVSDKLLGSTFQFDIWTIVKSVAVALILAKWMHDFYNPIVKDGKIINPIPNILEGIFYIALIAGSSQLAKIFEMFFSEIEHVIASKIELPKSSLDLYESQGIGGLGFLYDGVKYLTMAAMVVIDFMVFIGRILGLIAWQILFPVSLTLAILANRFQETLINQAKIFGAIYLSGAMYLLALYISNIAFVYLSTGPYKGWILVALLITLFAKKQMYSKADHWLEKIFS